MVAIDPITSDPINRSFVYSYNSSRDHKSTACHLLNSIAVVVRKMFGVTGQIAP